MIANVAIAGLFAGSFAVLALCYPSCRTARWFSVSYAIGALTPLSELILPSSPWPDVFRAASYVSFLTSLEGAALSLALSLGQRPPFKAATALFVVATVVRCVIWNGVRDSLPYEFAYQLPFALAASLSAFVVQRYDRKRAVHWALFCWFSLLALLFVSKPFLAVTFGSGRAAQDYISSSYALVSQASTGVILIAIGLTLLLMTVQDVISDAVNAAETDILTGLTNRRGFDRSSSATIEALRGREHDTAVLMIDIDHFKLINDHHGHPTGDEVLKAFAKILREVLSPAALIARVGGEEFAVLLRPANIETATRVAEKVRHVVGQHRRPGMPSFTISVGVTETAPKNSLRDVMRRADEALYEAKQGGRNRVVARLPREDQENIEPEGLAATRRL